MAERDPVLADLRSGLVTRDAPATEGPPDLAEILGYRFVDPGLLQQAFTHSSAFGSAAGRHRSLSYERLEFLGDRVLGLVVAEMLYQRFPEETEGALARRLAELARKETIARVALSLDLGRHLVISRGEAEGGGRDNPSLLADVCEAVIGALYLDGGLGPAKDFVERNWRKLLAEDVRPPKDAKTALQEWAQGSGLPLPSYRIRSSEGPPHDPVFEVAVEGRPPVTGTGRSRRAAEQAAAAALLAAVAPEAIGSRTSD